MADDASMTGTSGAGTPPASGGASSAVTVPDDTRQKFGELVDLIVGSESMNDEERQYWINILPIMTPDQLQSLKDILANERQQLAAIDAKYSKEIEQIGQEQFLKQVSAERQRRAQERTSAEQNAKAQEDVSAEDLLKKIDAV